MIYPRCPTCRTIFANKEIPYEEGLAEICAKENMSEEKKNESKERLLEKIGIKRYCCKPRFIGYVKKIELIS